MGNITGVALAITMGGPGAIFWMWVSALLGVTTKYFTCTLAVMFRGRDSNGELQGGPMYVIMEGLGKNWRPLAVFFSLMGMIGVLPMFQVNQLTQIVRDVVLIPNGVAGGFTTNLVIRTAGQPGCGGGDLRRDQADREGNGSYGADHGGALRDLCSLYHLLPAGQDPPQFCTHLQ